MEPNETIKVAVLEEQMKSLNKSVDNVSNKLDNLTEKIDNAYYTKKDHDTFYLNEFVPLQSAYDKLIWWIIGTLLAALGGLILASINFFTHI